MARLFISAALVVIVAMALFGDSARVQAKVDRHAGFYYPEPAFVEVYKSRARKLPEMDRRRRVAFVVAVVNAMLERPYPMVAAFFAKGDEAEKLIIVANQRGRLDTIYRARALLATLTSTARTTPLFTDFKVADKFTFLDFAKMLGFKLITVSDGDQFSHQIRIK